ncbi:hypothetical protein ACFE04_018471 [Oxalis oulophora]
MWNTPNWEKQKSRFSHCITTPEPKKGLQLQFYRDQAHLLVWSVPDMSLIQHGTLSCDSALIYSCFFDGTLKIFEEAVNLQLRCQINSTAYIQFDRRYINLVVVRSTEKIFVGWRPIKQIRRMRWIRKKEKQVLDL